MTLRTLALAVLMALPFAPHAQQADCIDASLIDPTAPCLTIFDPVCGCDGFTYSNDCLATVVGGVISWTPGECTGNENITCLDLAGLDFGACDMILGVALIDGECLTISGCGTTAQNGQDYGAFIFEDEAACLAACESGGGGDQPAGCVDLGGVDFGDCDLVLGVAMIDGLCQDVSGCDYTATDGLDYEGLFYNSIEDCQSGCVDMVCHDPNLIDPDTDCLVSSEYYCGCDSLLYTSPCEMIYEFGLTSWEVGFCDNPATCVNPDQIDTSVLCSSIFDPVCGCDNVTYDNSCTAYHLGGVQSWTEGPCSGNGLPEFALVGIHVVPNPAVNTVSLSRAMEAEVAVLDLAGRTLIARELLPAGAELDVVGLPQGLYLLDVYTPAGRITVRFEKR